MMRKASTPPDTEATRRLRRDGLATGVGPHIMVRVFLVILFAGLIAIAGGLAYLGEFPPPAHVQTIEKVLPNDKFQGH
jgi:hypothetical protein